MELDIEVMLATIMVKQPKSIMVSTNLHKTIREHLKRDPTPRIQITMGDLYCEIVVDRMLGDDHVIVEDGQGVQKMLATKQFAKKGNA